MDCYKDREWDNSTDGQRNLMQRADHASQPVYEPTDDDQKSSLAVWDSSKWQSKLLTQVRYAVDLKSVSEFAFELTADEAITIMGYAVEYTSKGAETIRGRQA